MGVGSSALPFPGCVGLGKKEKGLCPSGLQCGQQQYLMRHWRGRRVEQSPARSRGVSHYKIDATKIMIITTQHVPRESVPPEARVGGVPGALKRNRAPVPTAPCSFTGLSGQ